MTNQQQHDSQQPAADPAGRLEADVSFGADEDADYAYALYLARQAELFSRSGAIVGIVGMVMSCIGVTHHYSDVPISIKNPVIY